MTKIFNNLDELFSHVSKKVEEALDNDVSLYAKSVMYSHVYKDVYNAYSPRKYKRLMDEGGLSDFRNMYHEVYYELNNPNYSIITMRLRNIREDEGVDVVYKVEYGVGYIILDDNNRPVPPPPRYFVWGTYNELQNKQNYIAELIEYNIYNKV